jgi:hypothetical protein
MELKNRSVSISFVSITFPGIYLKYWASKKGVEYQDLALDFYVLLKVVSNSDFSKSLAKPSMDYLILFIYFETVFYIPFASDLFSKPRSYKGLCCCFS